MSLRLRRPSSVEIERVLAETRSAEPTYAEVGATKGERFPSGYRHDRYERQLGRGPEAFERGSAAVRAWQAQIGAGVEVFPEGARVGADDTVVLLLHVLGLWAAAPCRVLYIEEDPERFAFAYGTLRGHPEQGEVRFAVERDTAGDVAFRIVSFSRTVDPLARLGSPVTRRIQQHVTERYLDAIAAACGAEPS
jgi:uncharacterized protein (UPF0548 family)